MQTRVVDIQLTSRCNLDCFGCWGAPRYNDDNDMTMARFQWILTELLKNIGFNAVVYDGGEPLLINNIIEYFKFAKSSGYLNILSTNGILVKNKRDALKYVSAIGIPLDGPDEITNATFRCSSAVNHFHYAIEAIEFLNREYSYIHLKLGTVVTNENKNRVVDIGRLLKIKRLNVNTWKLYQFLPNFGQNKFQKNVEKHLSITDEEYSKVCQDVKSQFPEINIVYYYNPQNYGNVLIGPDGSLTTEMDAQGNIEPKLGNVFTDSIQKTRNTIASIMNTNKMVKRLKQSYNQ